MKKLRKYCYVEIAFDSTILIGIFGTGLFWVVRTMRKDRDVKRNSNSTSLNYLIRLNLANGYQWKDIHTIFQHIKN